MNPKHELIIQRFVDDELDEQGRAEFFQIAEACPELWRAAVLSMVEDRLFATAMVNQRTNETVAAVAGAGTAGSKASARKNPRKTWWSGYGPQILMTAASVLFVLTLAMRFNPVDRSNRPGGIANVPSASLSPDGSNDKLVDHPYSLTMDDLDVPVYQDEDRFRRELQRQLKALEPGLLDQFRSQGYQVRPYVRYMSARLDDGRDLLLPVQSFQLLRAGQ